MSDSKTVYLDLSRDNDGRGNQEEELEAPIPGLVRSTGLRPGQEDAEVKVEAEGMSPYASKKSFEELGLREELLKGIYAMGFNKPSRIQEFAIPNIIGDPMNHFIGQAQSGSGKTAAFVVGMLMRADESINAPQALCICPTRELTNQIYEVCSQMAQFTNLQIRIILKETNADRITEHIVIGTPGRVFDLIQKRRLDTRNIKVFVLDEADHMIGAQGMSELTAKINSKLPPPDRCQRLLFSATFSPQVARYASAMVPQPRVSVLLKPEELSVERLEQLYIDCGEHRRKIQVLNEMFAYLSVGQTIIFVNTRNYVDILYDILTREGHQVSRLHSQMEPEERDAVMKEFREGNSRVLVCTDVLARGIDVLQVSLVVNFDLPHDGQGNVSPETYLHRIGRSARYGAPGIAVNFVYDEKTKEDLQIIESTYKRPIKELRVEELESLDSMLKQIEHQLRKK